VIDIAYDTYENSVFQEAYTIQKFPRTKIEECSSTVETLNAQIEKEKAKNAIIEVELSKVIEFPKEEVIGLADQEAK